MDTLNNESMYMFYLSDLQAVVSVLHTSTGYMPSALFLNENRMRTWKRDIKVVMGKLLASKAGKLV